MKVHVARVVLSYCLSLIFLWLLKLNRGESRVCPKAWFSKSRAVVVVDFVWLLTVLKCPSYSALK